MSDIGFGPQAADALEEVALALATYIQRRRCTPTHLILDRQLHKELQATLPEGVDVAGAFNVTDVRVLALSKRVIFIRE